MLSPPRPPGSRTHTLRRPAKQTLDHGREQKLPPVPGVTSLGRWAEEGQSADQRGKTRVCLHLLSGADEALPGNTPSPAPGRSGVRERELD